MFDRYAHIEKSRNGIGYGMKAEERKNFAYNTIYRLSIIILPLILTPYISRTLGAKNVGLYTFSSTIALYFILFIKLGLDNYGNKSIAVCKDDIKARSKTFFSIYAMQIIMAILSSITYLLLVFTVFKTGRLIYFIQSIYVLSALFDISWFFHGLQRFRLTAMRSVMTKLVIIIFTFLFVQSGEDLWIYTLIMAGSFLLEQIILIPFAIVELSKVKISFRDITPHIFPNLKLFIPLLALSIYAWMDKLMLGVITGSTVVVAFYAYAENIINLPKGILSVLDTIMLPKISILVAHNKYNEAMDKMRHSMKINLFLSHALCFGIAGVAPVFMPWFLGSEYIETVPLTMMLSVTMIPMSITSIIQTHYLIPFSKESIYMKAVALGALTNLILNIILILKLGAFGAVIGTLGAEITVCIYELSRVKEIYHLKNLLKDTFPFLICGIMEFMVITAFSGLNIKVFYILLLQIFIGGSTYVAFNVLFALFISKDFKSLKEILYFIKS
jgi:O-antigen/teichoic acid export membrane protein